MHENAKRQQEDLTVKNVPEATDEPESEPSIVRTLFLSVVALAIICALFIEGIKQLDNLFRYFGW